MHSIASSLLDKILITFQLKSRRDVAIAKLYLHSLPSKNKGEKHAWKQNWNVGSKKVYCRVAIFLLPSLLLCMRILDNKGALKQLNLVWLSKRFYTLGKYFVSIVSKLLRVTQLLKISSYRKTTPIFTWVITWGRRNRGCKG